MTPEEFEQLCQDELDAVSALKVAQDNKDNNPTPANIQAWEDSLTIRNAAHKKVIQ